MIKIAYFVVVMGDGATAFFFAGGAVAFVFEVFLNLLLLVYNIC